MQNSIVLDRDEVAVLQCLAIFNRFPELARATFANINQQRGWLWNSPGLETPEEVLSKPMPAPGSCGIS